MPCVFQGPQAQVLKGVVSQGFAHPRKTVISCMLVSLARTMKFEI